MNYKPADTAFSRTHYLIRIFSAFFLLFQISFVNAQAINDLRYLNDSANSDGSISDAGDLTNPYQSTAESIITYEALGQSGVVEVTNAQSFLENNEIHSTENLSLRLLTSPLNTPVFNSALAEINRRQNQDGGIGTFIGFDSDVISTSFALRALFRAHVSNEVSHRAINYLLSQQNTDGSWSLDDNPKRVEVTALVMNALWLYRQSVQINDALSIGITYLSSQRTTNNLWGEMESSALALSAILNVAIDRNPYQTSLTSFSGLANGNGSFDDDVYLTALGLRVLDAAQKPAPDEIILSGRIVDGDTDLPLVGVAIQLSGVNSTSELSDSNGEFDFTNLSAGNYNLLVSADGFGELRLNTLLTLGTKANLGDIQLSRLRVDPETGEPVTTGTVRGTISDRRTGLPLSDAIVSVAGGSISTATDSAGVYQLNSVPSGALQISVSATGYGSLLNSANLPAGQTLIFSPKLQEEVIENVSLEGVVSDRINGSPLAGVEIQVSDGDGQIRTVTGSSVGSYSIDDIAVGDINIRATLSGYHPSIVSTAVQAGTRLVYSPQMDLLSENPGESGGALTGVVIDSLTGRGLALAQLSLEYESGESFNLITGQDGEFSFSDLPQGNATILVDLAEYDLFSRSLDIQAGLLKNIGPVELVSGEFVTASLTGNVADVRTRESINGAIISARNTVNNRRVETLSNAQGQFLIPYIFPGEYEVTVSFAGFNSQVFTIVITQEVELDVGEVRLRQPGVDALLADLTIEEMDTAQVQSNQTDFMISGEVSGVIVNRGHVGVTVPLSIIAFEDRDRDGMYTSADTLLGTSAIVFDGSNTLDIDSTASYSIELSGELSFHDAPITVLVDANNIIPELSESNNTNSSAGLCTGQQQGPRLDLALCMDSSGSISFSDFQLQLEGTARAIENENIIPRDGSVRVSAIQFFTRSKVELTPTIIDGDNVTEVANTIRAIRKENGGTSVHSCIDTATGLINGATPATAHQVIDVSTDGQFSLSAAEQARARAMASGIDVLNSIGVGDEIDVDLLNAIVFPQPSGGDQGFVVTVDGYQEYIDGIANKIQRETRVPDLTVGGLSLLDDGSTNTSMALVIGNAGSGNITSPVTIQIYNGSSAQGELLIEQAYSSGLLSGEGAQITLDNIASSRITADTLEVVVSLEEGLSECNQNNNRQQIPVTSLLGDINLTLNGSVFGSVTDVDLRTQVTNTGSLEGNYNVALAIMDSARVDVANIANFDVEDLRPTESMGFNNAWNTGTIASGSYIAQATLSDVTGNVLDVAEVSFVISDLINSDGTPNGTHAATLRATTDRPVYHVDDQVQLSVLAENITAIHPISDPRLVMVVTDVNGSEIFNETVSLPSLVPGQLMQAMRALNLVQAPVGSYRYQVTLIGSEPGNSNMAYITVSTNFEVINDPDAAIRGSVLVQSAQIIRGEPQSCTFNVDNTGSQALTGLSVNYRVVNIDSQVMVSNDSASIELPPGGSNRHHQSLSTGSLQPGHYACVLETVLNGETRVLATAQFSVIGSSDNITAGLSLISSPRILVLADPMPTRCESNLSIILRGTFNESLEETQSNYAKVYNDQTIVDFENTTALEFNGINTQLELNQNKAVPDLSITALDTTQIELKLSSEYGLIGDYRIEQSLDETTLTPELSTGNLDFQCGSPYTVGDQLGDFMVVDVENIELDASNSYRPLELPRIQDQLMRLEDFLSGKSYTLVTSQLAFTDELLTGQYQQYLILSERKPLDELVSKLLTEAVNRGESLIFASGFAPANTDLQVVLGITPYLDEASDEYKPLLTDGEGAILFDSAIHSSETISFNLDRLYSKVELIDATIAGKLQIENDPGYFDLPVLTHNTYGQGQAVFIGYDVLAELTAYGSEAPNAHAVLLRDSMNFVTPNAPSLRSGYVVPVEFRVNNLGSDVNITASMLWPESTQVVDAVPNAVFDAPRVNWSFSLAANETVLLKSWAIPAYANNQATLYADIFLGNDTIGDPLHRAELTLQVSGAEDVQIVLSDLDVLISQATDEVIFEKLSGAYFWLEAASYANNQANVDLAINHALTAINLLKTVNTSEARLIRERVDWLMWQWGQQLSSGSVQ